MADGRTLAVGSSTIVLYDAVTGREIRQFQASTGALLLPSPDGKILATGELGYPSFQLCETATGRHLQTPAAEIKGPVTSAAFSPDGKTIITGSWDDRVIHLWEVSTGKALRRFVGHEAEVTCLALSPDGRTLASAGLDRTVRLWEVTTGKERRRMDGHRGTVTSLTWSADGKTLASGSADGTALVWDVSR